MMSLLNTSALYRLANQSDRYRFAPPTGSPQVKRGHPRARWFFIPACFLSGPTELHPNNSGASRSKTGPNL